MPTTGNSPGPGGPGIPPKRLAIITVTWRHYTFQYLEPFLASLRGQVYDGEIQLYVTDNESTPETADHIARVAPEARRIANPANDGFAKGANDGMRQALADGCDYLAVLNVHTTLAPDCLQEMVRTLESDENIGVVQARIMMMDGTTVVSLGVTTHFLGFGYCVGYRDDWASWRDRVDTEIFYPFGSSMLFRRQTLERSGLLEEQFWMYNEDQELGWRLRLLGLRCVLAPDAVQFNEYAFLRSVQKFYWVDRNRVLSLLMCHKWPTLLVILPAFLVMELGLVLFSLRAGWFREKLRVWAYFLRPGNWVRLLRARRRNQRLRVVGDREILKLMPGRIWYPEIDDWKLRLINPVMDAYWRVVRRLVFW